MVFQAYKDNDTKQTHIYNNVFGTFNINIAIIWTNNKKELIYEYNNGYSL